PSLDEAADLLERLTANCQVRPGAVVEIAALAAEHVFVLCPLVRVHERERKRAAGRQTRANDEFDLGTGKSDGDAPKPVRSGFAVPIGERDNLSARCCNAGVSRRIRTRPPEP